MPPPDRLRYGQQNITLLSQKLGQLCACIEIYIWRRCMCSLRLGFRDDNRHTSYSSLFSWEWHLYSTWVFGKCLKSDGCMRAWVAYHQYSLICFSFGSATESTYTLSCYLASCSSHTCNAFSIRNWIATCYLHVRINRYYDCYVFIIPITSAFHICDATTKYALFHMASAISKTKCQFHSTPSPKLSHDLAASSFVSVAR